MKIKEFKQGDWITTADGKIAQIVSKDYSSVTYSNGYVDTTTNGETQVFPLTLHTKVIAESIGKYMSEFNKKGILYPKTGRKLEEFGYRLMKLPEDSPKENFQSIYEEIKLYMSNLEEHMSYFKD